MLKDNLREYRTNNGISQTDMAKRLNLTRQAYNHYETGRRVPPLSVLKDISAILNIGIEILSSDDNTPITAALADESSRHKGKKGVRIPVIGISAAGVPLETVQNYIDDNDPDTWEEITENLASSGDYAAIRIKGGSMEPRIQDGDIVIVRVQSDVNSGETAIVIVNGDEATCKKIKKRPEGVMLISNNPAFEPMFYSNSDIENLPVRIFGKVIEVRGKI